MTNNTLEMIPEMLPIKVISERTGLSYCYIRNLCLKGEIVHIRAGNKYLVNWNRFLDYLNTNGREVCND